MLAATSAPVVPRVTWRCEPSGSVRVMRSDMMGPWLWNMAVATALHRAAGRARAGRPVQRLAKNAPARHRKGPPVSAAPAANPAAANAASAAQVLAGGRIYWQGLGQMSASQLPSLPPGPTPLPGRRSARQRPLHGVLLEDGRSAAVVVTAHAMRLVINVEADISAIPLARVRRDDGLNLWRTDRPGWQIRLDSVPPDSWVFELPLASPAAGRRRALILLLLVLAGAGLWALTLG